MTGIRVEVGLEWDEHPVMQAVRRERIDTVDKLWSKGMPMEAINDYLQLEMDKFEGWDVGFVPINVTPLEHATEPEPAPAENPALAETNGRNGNNGSNEPAAVKAMVKMLREEVSKGHVAAGRSKAARAALWEKHMRARAGVQRAYVSKASKVLNDFRAVALRKLQQQGRF